MTSKISNEYIAKIEGHGTLDIDWNKNTVKMNTHEGERLFEGILVGRSSEEVHWITPRICGVCPIAHNLSSLGAIEDAYGIQITETAKLLRDLMVVAQMIQSHVLHLFFLVSPDYMGIDRGTELAQKNPVAFAKALSLKELGDNIATIVAGRNVHPTRTTVGGFHKIPTKEELLKLQENLKATQEAAKWTADLFAGIKYPELKVELDLVAIKGDKIISSVGGETSVADYKKNIEEELRSYSTAKFGKFQEREMMVGSLARLAINGAGCEGVGSEMSKLDFQNPFHNNLAQAIEVFTYHQKGLKLIEHLLGMEMSDEIIGRSESATLKGIGHIEAPRGGLYNEIYLDKNDDVIYANIITPTVQNLTSMEKSAKALLEQYADKSKEEKVRLMEMMIRAYDPCITCSVH